MDEIAAKLAINPPAVCGQIEGLLRTVLRNLHRDGAVVPLSGGLDSAVAATLTVRALGTEKVHFLNMPERDSAPIHQEHARKLAAHLGVPLTVRRISSVVRAAGAYKLLPLGLIPFRKLRTRLVELGKGKFLSGQEFTLLADRLQPKADSWIARGNAYAIAKHRVRMVIVYLYAEVHNLMVVGAANRTELLTGTYSKWGVDHCADVMPIMHLFRSQVETLAEYLQVPEFIRRKPADPDIMPGINDKGKLLGDFTVADPILYGLEHDVPRERLAQIYGTDSVEALLTLWERSRHMRESPYSLNKELEA